MKNCDNLFITDQAEYENIHKMCSDAYTQGRMAERTLAIEAYRLRCHHLFGNRCMPSIGSSLKRKKLCDADCPYIRKYEFELYKLGGCAESTPE